MNDRLDNAPQYELTAEQQALKERARTLAREVVEPRAAEVDRTEQYPWDNVEALRDAGFMGMTIPRARGGQGRSFLDVTLVIEEMAQVCGVTGRIVVEANMGAISALMHYGTEAQKRLGAEMVLSGDKPAICITEPGAGSAAGRDDHPRRPARRRLRRQRHEALDHRRRRLAPASRVRAGCSTRVAPSRGSAASSRSATRPRV